MIQQLLCRVSIQEKWKYVSIQRFVYKYSSSIITKSVKSTNACPCYNIDKPQKCYKYILKSIDYKIPLIWNVHKRETNRDRKWVSDHSQFEWEWKVTRDFCGDGNNKFTRKCWILHINMATYICGVCMWYSGEGNGKPLQYSCLGNPMDRGTRGATVHGVTKESHTT